jgi:hypothetical protein
MGIGIAFGACVVAVSVWSYGAKLEPDAHGRALSSLPFWLRWMLFVAVVVVSSGGAVLVTSAVGDRPAALAFGLFAAASPALAVIDSTAHRIPHLVSGVLAAAGIVCFCWDAVVSSNAAALERAGLAALAAGAFGGALWLAFPGQLGRGDVTLLTVIGAYAGWVSWPAVSMGLFLGFAAAVPAFWIGRGRARDVGGYRPLGAFLLAGWWAAFTLNGTGWI